MKPEDYIERFVKSKQLQLDANGNPTGKMLPFISVPVKQQKIGKSRGAFPDIEPRTDTDGDLMLRLFPRNQIKEYQLLGWEVYKIAKPPKGLAKAEAPAEPAKVKKGPFGRPIPKETQPETDELDS